LRFAPEMAKRFFLANPGAPGTANSWPWFFWLIANGLQLRAYRRVRPVAFAFRAFSLREAPWADQGSSEPKGLKYLVRFASCRYGGKRRVGGFDSAPIPPSADGRRSLAR